MSSPADNGSGPRMLGRYHLLDEIGHDALGVVHLARLEGPQGFQRWAMVRRVHPLLASDTDLVQTFFEAARIAARIQHPNVTTTFDVGERDGPPWLAREYIHGEPLSNLILRVIATDTKVPWDIACRIVADAALGIDTIHDLTPGEPKIGFLYGHVSPLEIVATYDGKTKVVDGSLPRLAGLPPQQTHAFPYTAPEVLHGQPCDRRVDVFALGVVLWELCAGKRLFAGVDAQETAALLEARVVPFLRTTVKCPTTVDEIVRRAVARAPEDRHPTCRVLARELMACLVSKGLVVSDDDVGRYLLGVFADKFEEREAFLHSAANVTEIFDRSTVAKELGLAPPSRVAAGAAPPAPLPKSVRPAAPPVEKPASPKRPTPVPPDVQSSSAPTIPYAAAPTVPYPPPADTEPTLPGDRREPSVRPEPKLYDPFGGDEAKVARPALHGGDDIRARPPQPVPRTSPDEVAALPMLDNPVDSREAPTARRKVDPAGRRMEPTLPSQQSPRVLPVGPTTAPRARRPPPAPLPLGEEVEPLDPWIAPLLVVLAVIFVTFGAIFVWKWMKGTEAQAAAAASADAVDVAPTAPTAPLAPTAGGAAPGTSVSAAPTAPAPTNVTAPPATSGTITIGSAPLRPDLPPRRAPAPPPRTAAAPPPSPPPPPAPGGGRTGLLTVFCSPACDEVLDGARSLGPSPVFKLSVAAGPHRLTLRTTSPAVEKTLSVTVNEDETARSLRQAME